MLAGLMQDVPLLISSLIEHAALNHPRQEVVARQVDGSIFRYTYIEAAARARRLARALGELGVGEGDRVATLAWNTHRHFECFYGISGMGAVCHTVNPRLFKDQIRFIINHAEDGILLIDADFAPMIAAMLPDLPAVRQVIILGHSADGLDTAGLDDLLYYEDLLAGTEDDFDWPVLDERSASSLCYTSGTTANPKGVLYSHRSTLIHALAASGVDNLALGASDVIMPVAPLYHANAWSLPYSAPMVGAKLVLPGRHLDAASLLELIREEGVTTSCGVPTVWTLMLEHLDKVGGDLSALDRIYVGGTALPASIQDRFADQYNVRAVHLWGMTETSPIGTIARETPEIMALDHEARRAQLQKQGRLPFGVEMKTVGPDGTCLPRDGKSSGDIWIRGPWIANGYFGEDEDSLDDEGWFPTGDVGHLDAYGFMQITDRTKDVIKSGGEWISSVEIENIVVAHPKVSLAAVVGVSHPKWDERPILCVTPVGDDWPEKAELLEFLTGRIAKWWLPDDVIVLDEMPMTATGKIRKADLRRRFRDHLIAADR